MRIGAAVLLFWTITNAPAAAQWDIGLEVRTMRYRGSSHDTANSGGPETFRPANATAVGLRLERALGQARFGFHASYAGVGLTAAGPGLILTDNSTGQLIEGQLLLNFRVVGIGSSGAIRAELGPSLHLWKSGDENRTRLGGVTALAYEWPVTRRFSGAIRLEGIFSKSWFDAWCHGVGLGLRYRL
jgi:hypothetical protein